MTYSISLDINEHLQSKYPKLTLEQHEFDVLKGIIADRLNSLKKNIARHSDNLDEYEKDITNYTTYDLHAKISRIGG